MNPELKEIRQVLYRCEYHKGYTKNQFSSFITKNDVIKSNFIPKFVFTLMKFDLHLEYPLKLYTKWKFLVFLKMLKIFCIAQRLPRIIQTLLHR